mmetsp:Transcript_21681/g.56274  ORF Transcript_21681/g.56274 Transcript_21681/m.56274 type:complete len:156 (-) Transcript_21681:401-868(-)
MIGAGACSLVGATLYAQEKYGAMSEVRGKYQKHITTTETGLRVRDDVMGDGPTVEKGDKVTINYHGMFDDGKTFHTTYKYKQPLIYTVGEGEVCAALDEGVVGMKEHGIRYVIARTHHVKGGKGIPNTVPPNMDNLMFNIQLEEVQKAAWWKFWQ